MQKSAAKEWYNLLYLDKATKHQNLMPALSAFQHGNIRFILQEEAEMSLHDYLKGSGKTFGSEELWTQLQGIADGLAELHKLHQGSRIAYHRDLKPANILCLRGILKIADFGLTEFRSTGPEDLELTGIPNTYETGSYAAPRQGNYTRKDDIWSLACIFSELATSDIQGRNAVEEYRKARIEDCPSKKDTPRFHYQQSVKSAVLKKHHHLCHSVQSHDAVNDSNENIQFQQLFYCSSLCSLLNKMFRHENALHHASHAPDASAVPDAGEVASSIQQLRTEAISNLQRKANEASLAAEPTYRHVEEIVTSIEASKEKFEKCVDERAKNRFERTTSVHFTQFVIDLQAKQSAGSGQRALRRLEPYIVGLKDLERLLSEFCNAAPIMAWVWVRNLAVKLHCERWAPC